MLGWGAIIQGRSWLRRPCVNLGEGRLAVSSVLARVSRRLPGSGTHHLDSSQFYLENSVVFLPAWQPIPKTRQ